VSGVRPGGRQVQWGIVDQALSAGTNFLISLVLVRRLTAEQFGGFSLVTIVFVLAVGGTRVLNLDPLIVRHASVRARYERWTPKALGASLVLGVLISVGVTIAASFVPSMRSMLLVLAAALPLLLLQDAGRTVAFGMRRGSVAARSDGLWAALQLVSLVAALLLLPAAPPWLLVGTWLLPGAIAGALIPRQLSTRVDVRGALLWFTASKDLGRPLLWVYCLSAAPPLLLMALAPAVTGVAELGVARAAYIPFGIFGIVLQGSLLMLLPAAAGRSPRGTVRLAAHASAALTSVAVIWTAAVLLVPADMGHLLLGDTWSQAEDARRVFGVCIIAQAVGTGPLLALRAMGMAGRLLQIRAVTLPAVLGGGLLVAASAGATGIALGMAFGDVLAAALAWRQLRVSSRSDVSPASWKQRMSTGLSWSATFGAGPRHCQPLSERTVVSAAAQRAPVNDTEPSVVHPQRGRRGRLGA
jgi:hypothetical protein